jgi:hypothetical protein
MSILNISDTASAALHDWYSEVYDDGAYRENVFLGLVTKEDGRGQQVKQAIKIARTAGHGADIASAITNQSAELRKAFFTPWGKSYAVENVDNTEIDVSEGDDAAVVEILGDALEGCLRKCSEDLEHDLFGDGYGTRGTISSNSGGGPYVLTLGQATDTLNWQVGDIGVSSAANNSGALDAGSFNVTAVDTDAGTLTVSANGGWSPTNTHVIFATADKINGSYATALKVLGLKSWIPLTAPTGGDNFGGVDRSVDPNKLAGVRVDARGMNPFQAINLVATKVGLNKSAKPNVVMASPLFYATLQDQLQNSVRYDRSEGKTPSGASVFFDGIKIEGPRGPMMVHSAPGCDADRFYVLSMGTWTLRSPKNTPVKMAGRAGKDGLIDVYNADQIQIRQKYLANLSCSFPGANGVGQLA